MNNVSNYISDLIRLLGDLSHQEIDHVIQILHAARFENRQVFIMGNGGSAATASHFACDLAKSTRRAGLPAFRAIGLADNMAAFSAFANDEGYENVFTEQMANLINPGDIVIAISASGNSKNILKAVDLANQIGATSIGFTGFDGGKLKPLVNLDLHIPSHRIGQVEDAHLMLEHLICETLGKMADEVLAGHSTQTPFKITAENWLSNNLQLFDQDILAPAQSSRELLNRINQEFEGKIGLHEMVARLMRLTLSITGASSGTTIVMDRNGNVIDGVSSYAGQIQPVDIFRLSDMLQRGLAGWVVKNRQSALVHNTLEDSRWIKRNWEDGTDHSRSALSVPMLDKDRVDGVVTLAHLQPGQFTLEDLALLTAIMTLLSYSIEPRRQILLSQQTE